jgi:creatinine amidohydrolase
VWSIFDQIQELNSTLQNHALKFCASIKLRRLNSPLDMSHHIHFWSDLTTNDFGRLDASRAIAVLPLAATEQHGPHLPLSVDVDIVNGVIHSAMTCLNAGGNTNTNVDKLSRKDLSVLVLPTQCVGLSPEHAAFAGTLTLRPETLIRLWTDIAESVKASGIHKLVLFNAHGGHVGAMDVVARDLRARLGMLVYSVNWHQLPLLDEKGQDANALFTEHEHRFGVHAGDVETSVMLALKPHAVKMSEAQNFHSSSEDRARSFPILGNGRSAKLAWQMQDYNTAGAAGNAAAATALKGQILLDAAGRALADLLLEIDRLPEHTIRP